MDTKKLRQKILDLAIRGKLVPQDPNDEPASVLLERIRAEKEQLIKEGKIKRSKKSAATDKSHYENVPFEIPENWCWCKLSDVCNFESGYAFSSDDYKDKGTPLVRISNIQDGLVSLDNCVYIEGDIDKRFIINNGDLLIAMSGATTGKMGVYQYDCPALLNQRVGNIKVNTSLLLQKYRDYFMQSQGDLILKLSYGGAQPNVSAKIISDLFIPIPSLNEQEKIVAEIEKWFGFIDEIENGKIELESHIKKTKSKILDLAISGKLVPQDPNDEPAIELLKRINPDFESCDNSHYENLPQGWVKAGFKDIYQTISSRDYQIQQRDIINEGLYPVVSQSSNYIEGYYNNKEMLLDVTAPVLIFGDHTRVVKYIDFPFVIGADGVKVIKPLVNDKFAYYLLLYTSQHIENKGYSRHFQLIAKANYCIPPLREQTHIVKTIETLFETINTITAEL